jgi:hypothetical protein
MKEENKMSTKKYLLNVARFAIILLILFQVNGNALAFKTGIHEELTIQALPFIRPLIMEDINDEHHDLDWNYSITSSFHFDDCNFSGSAAKINAKLKDARLQADPKAFDSGDLADQWGQALHPIEDFYSHSNWVETGQTTLLDSGLGLWNALKPYSMHDGVLLIEGEEAHPLGPDSFLDPTPGYTVQVFTGSTPPPGVLKNVYIPGIISGTWWGNTYDQCPDNVEISHGDLNKDTPDILLHDTARDLATWQARHEWCRLLNISNAKYNLAGPAALLGLWVSPNGIPHPVGTPCEPETPGPLEVAASVTKIQVLNDQDPSASGELNFVSLIFTGNFRQSARSEVANSLSIEDPAVIPSADFPASELPKPVRLCVKSTDTVAVSLQGWDDDGDTDKVFENPTNVDEGDEPLDGVTLSLTGPSFGAGTKTVSSDDLKVTFNITVNATDSDGDGLGDCLEKTIGTLINDPDSDNDGLNDGAEVNTYGTNPSLSDSDNDGLGDSEEINVYGTYPMVPDSDNDGLLDSTEINGKNPTLPMDADTDNDGLLDGDEDASHDGALNYSETDPNNPDWDRDTLKDGCEVLGKNPTNPFEMDTDKDGLSDGVEDANHNCAIDEHDREPDETDPNDPDSDDDALTDGIEVQGSNPTVPMKADTDNDGLLDGIEDKNQNGAFDAGETNPNNPDFDQDALMDGCEVNGNNPTNPFEADSDKDGLSDGAEDANLNCALDLNETNPNDADTDDDELNDRFEVANGTNPIDADSDDNSILDGEDVGWIQQAVNAIPDTLFMPSGRKAILDQLDAIKTMVFAGQFNTAVNELMLLRTHVDGCGAAPDADDWLMDCTEQLKLQTFIDLLIKNLTN